MGKRHIRKIESLFVYIGLMTIVLGGWPTSADADLVALYRFDNGNADDSTSNTLHGTMHGNAMIVGDADPDRGMVLVLDDMDNNTVEGSSHVYINDPTGLLNFSDTGPHQGSATVAAWVWSEGWTIHDQIFGQGEWNDGIGLAIKPDRLDVNGNPRLWTGFPGGPTHLSGGDTGGVPQNSTWNHIAVTFAYDGTNTTVEFYLNGTAIGVCDPGVDVGCGGGNADPVFAGRVNAPVDNIGADGLPGSDGVGDSRIGLEWRDSTLTNMRWPVAGRIDDLAVFDTALDAQEIASVMEGQFDLSPVNLGLTVDTSTGEVVITNPTQDSISFSSYRITSAGGSLDAGGWNPIATGAPLTGFPQGDGSGNGWEAGPNPSSGELVEWYLTGESALAASESISLGNAYNETLAAADLRFQYTVADGTIKSGLVEYVMGPGGQPGDYNGNGVVDAADYTVWRDNMGSATSLPNDDTPGVGPDDFTRWINNFGNGAGSGAAAGGAVPEPGMATLALLGIVAAGGLFRRRG